MLFGLDTLVTLRDERGQSTQDEAMQSASQNAWHHAMHIKISAWIGATRHSQHTAQRHGYEQLWEEFLHARNMEYVSFMIHLFCIT